MATSSKSRRLGGDVSCTALRRNDWHLDLAHDLPSRSLQGDPSIDDPVNDSGIGPRCGDLQVSRKFASVRTWKPRLCDQCGWQQQLVGFGLEEAGRLPQIQSAFLPPTTLRLLRRPSAPMVNFSYLQSGQQHRRFPYSS